MKEHIVVFDEPPQLGKGVPQYYDLKISDIPEQRKGRIIALLKKLGFVAIKDQSDDKKPHGFWNETEREWGVCISAQYHVRKDTREYDNFWGKKEKVELEIDRLQIAN